MPEPIRSLHHLFFINTKEKRKLKINLTQKAVNMRLLSKELRRVSSITKSGFLIPSDIAIRLSTSIQNTFRVVTSLIFKKNSENNCILAINSEGKICEISKIASKYFKKNTLLSSYNSEFEEIDKVIFFNFIYFFPKELNAVFTEIIEMKNLSKDSYKELVQDNSRMRSWLNFLENKELRTYRIIGLQGQVLTIEGRFEGYVLHKLKTFFKYFNIRKIENEIFNFDRMIPKFNSKNLEVIKNLVNYSKKNINQAENFEDWSKEIIFDKELIKESSRAQLDGSKISPILLKKNIPVFEEESQEEVSEKLLNEVKVFTTARKKIMDVRITKENKESSNEKEEVFEGNVEEGKDGNEEIFIFEQNEEKIPESRILDRGKGRSDQANKSNSFSKISKPKHIHKNWKIFEFLEKKFTSRKSKKNLMILITIFPIIIIMNIYFFRQIIPKLEKTQEIIRKQAMAVDTYSWVIWAQVYSILSLDIVRGLRQNWITSPTSEHFIQDMKYIRKWHVMLNRTGMFFLSPENDIDKLVRDDSTSSLDYKEKWLNSEVILTLSSSSYEFKPYEIIIPKRASIKFMQGFSHLIYYRDYENNTDIKEFKSNEDRSADPDEEIYRVNLVGDQNRLYFELSHFFFEYITSVAQGHRDNLLFDSILLCGANLVLVVILVGFYLLEVKKMKRFYEKVFDMKVKKFSLNIN